MYYQATTSTNAGTRIFGVVVSAAIVAGLIVAMLTARSIVVEAITKTEVAIVDAPEIEEEEPPPPPPVDVELPPPPPQVVLPEFRFDLPPPPNAIQQVERVERPANPPPVAKPPPPAVPATKPTVGRRFQKPDYPPVALRAKEEGSTRMEMCVDAKGAVTSVKLIGSSGSDRLDKAAMEHMQNERMVPAKNTAGQNVEFCGWTQTIEWRLEDAR